MVIPSSGMPQTAVQRLSKAAASSMELPSPLFGRSAEPSAGLLFCKKHPHSRYFFPVCG